MLLVNELFAGVGSQAMALDRLGVEYKVVGIAEIDKYAIKSYEAIHGAVRNYGDISKIDRLDYADLWTYSFPCQDLSVAGKGRGIKEGTRSGLLFEVQRLLEVAQNSNTLPKYLLLENVKNLVGKKHRQDFDKWLEFLSMMGYTNYWQVLNGKDYGVPQNRERVFVMSIRGNHKPFVFPKGFDNGIRLKDILEDTVEEKYYIAQEKVEKLLMQIKDKESIILDMGQSKREGKPREYNEYSPCLQARDYKDPKLVCEIGILGGEQKNQAYKTDGICTCLTANMGTGGGHVPMVIPVLTPDRIEKRQNGIRFKEDGEPSFCITTQDRHGVMQVGSFTKEEINDNERQRRVYSENGCSPTILARTDNAKVLTVGHIPYPNSNKKHQSNTIISTDGLCQTIDTMQGGNRQPKVLVNYSIRKLTPRECWRLMGFKDTDFDKAQAAGISNSQLYKQAGNSIIADVLYYLFKAMLDTVIDEEVQEHIPRLENQMCLF